MTVALRLIFANAPYITHFLVLVFLVVSHIARSSVCRFLGREPLHVFYNIGDSN